MSDQLESLPLIDLPASGLRPFLHAIQYDPEDDLVIRALGDWLEEMGDARAELVRAGLFGDLRRLQRWRRAFGERWWGRLPQEVRLDVRGGLLELVYPAALLAAAESRLPAGLLRVLLEQGWVFRVVLEGQASRPVAAWAEELLRHVTSLRWQDAADNSLLMLPPLDRLRELDLGKSTGLTSAGLAHLERWPGLQRLRLAGCPGLVGTVRLRGLAELRWLRLGWNPSLSGVALADLPSLASLDLGMCDQLAALQLSDLPQLRELSLRCGFSLTDTTLVALSHLESLRSLDLTLCGRIEGSGLSYLAGLTKLRQLVLRECSSLGRVRLEELAHLEELDLGTCRSLTELHLRDLPRLARLHLDATTHLRTVSISGLLALDSLPVSGSRLDLADLPELQALNLNSTSQVRLCNLPGLRRLGLRSCGRLAVEGLSGLQRLVARGGEAITADTLEALAAPSVQELDLRECPRLVQARLRNLPALRALVVSSCPSLGLLELTGPCPLPALQIDRCVRLNALELADLGELRSLRLEALANLARLGLSGLDKLRHLDVRDCANLRTVELAGMPERVCQTVQARLPGCQVVRR